MTTALGALLVLAALATLLATMTAFSLHASDPAGNGLAGAHLVVILAIAWSSTAAAVLIALLITPAPQCPADAPWQAIGFGAVTGLVVGIVSHLVSLPYLLDGSHRGPWRTFVRGSLFTVPTALLLHIAWRGIGLPLPAAFALWGCGGLVGLGAAVPWLARAAARRKRARSAATLSSGHIAYPALLLRPRVGVTVVRSAADVEALPPERHEPPLPVLVDATGATWLLQPRDGGGEWVVGRGTALELPAVKAMLLDIACLHPDAAEDARIRHLVAMQRDVTGLSFVLPR